MAATMDKRLIWDLPGRLRTWFEMSTVTAGIRAVIGHPALRPGPSGRCTIGRQPNTASGERLVR